MQDPVGKRHDAGIVPHDQDRRSPLMGGSTEQADHLFAVRPVEGTGRLIGETEGRLLDQSLANDHPLLFAAGELIRV